MEKNERKKERTKFDSPDEIMSKFIQMLDDVDVDDVDHYYYYYYFPFTFKVEKKMISSIYLLKIDDEQNKKNLVFFVVLFSNLKKNKFFSFLM